MNNASSALLCAASVPSTPATTPAGLRQRLVLDTNVLLDLFVFGDPRWQALADALEAGLVDAFTREDCRAEWLAVLDYPHLPVTPENKPAICARFDRLLQCLPIEQVNSFGLPLCTDRDDQKFLELALQCGAHVLVSKDKAVLKLGKRTRRQGMFAIVAPQHWQLDAFPPAA